jgi:methionyl-tRNA formyltransferase
VNIIFAGTPAFAVPTLRALLDAAPHRVCTVLTQPDRPAGRGRRLTSSPVKQLALAADVSVYQPARLGPESVAQLQALAPDLMVVAAYGLILPGIVLAVPRHGCINVHASLLPRWRGAAPIARAIEAGDRLTGITIMQMDEGLDTGGIIAQGQTPISEDDTAQTLHDRLAELGGKLLMQSVHQLASTGALTARRQDETAACYAPKISKAEAQINWSETAIVLHRKVRAYNPWPIAYTRFRDRLLRIWEVGRVEHATHDPQPMPGTVAAIDFDALRVGTGDGVLPLRRLQLEGGRPIAAQAFINGHHPRPGERLG